MSEVSLKPVIEELENLFSTFNRRFFESKLEASVITVSPDHTRGAYGWCTSWKAWKAGDDEGHYEINLCAEYLNRSFEETCGTLLHETIHLHLPAPKTAVVKTTKTRKLPEYSYFNYKKFRRVFGEQRWTVKGLAEAIGSQPDTVSNWKNGHSVPRAASRDRLCEAMDKRRG